MAQDDTTSGAQDTQDTQGIKLTLDSPIKFLTAAHLGTHSDYDYRPYLPREDGRPGKWLTVPGTLDPCYRGLHYTSPQYAPRWLHAACWLVEDGAAETRLFHEDKWVTRRLRLVRRLDTWNERTARLFACDCAEHVLPVFERRYPKDHRPHEAIAVARRYANGHATGEELIAAGVAAWDAAWDAAWAAAGDAAWAAARDAAWAAAGDAAWAAAGDAAWDAAWAAAGAAARDAAWAAAGDAAWAAAGDAAWAAAGAAERAWQAERLLAYLNGEIA